MKDRWDEEIKTREKKKEILPVKGVHYVTQYEHIKPIQEDSRSSGQLSFRSRMQSNRLIWHNTVPERLPPKKDSHRCTKMCNTNTHMYRSEQTESAEWGTEAGKQDSPVKTVAGTNIYTSCEFIGRGSESCFRPPSPQPIPSLSS